MIVQDYISKRFRGEKPISRRHMPKGVDSCFGNFPMQYKTKDAWDGNPTLRRDSRTSYTSPQRSPTKTRRPKGSRQQQQQQQQRDPGGETRTAERRGEGGVPSLASTEKGRKATRVRPKTAGARPTSRGRKGGGVVLEDLPDRQELEATRTYLLTQGKFRITPSKLMASLEAARATNSRPLSAPASVRRRRAPAPPKAGAWRRRAIAATLFRKYYVRGDLPISVDHCGHRNAIRWKIRPADLDFHVYLPIFFDGLREVEDPYRFLAVQGTVDMIEGAPDKVLPVIPQLILPMKTALNTREPRIICPTLKILQQMILLSPMIGQALVPYYRQLLPMFNLFRGMNSNMGDAIDYNQRSRINVGKLIMETLEVMEQFGGPDAFINIKYMIPTYESCGP
ncbi:conserved unknown protein [Ectocarpus siliculosus]|uniref:Uncharacterized protein n=1 Tax=Ectocarpus siliculosus TaxID=2880 RepID=D8LSZ3_ECTSI|nr:conserved unknown protein [Ectocarpus siliculosus]|eukprot:CBN77920.1 conserved unknown protein [Ectocarpus siliculosus]